MTVIGVYIANIYINTYTFECDLRFVMSVVGHDFKLDMFSYKKNWLFRNYTLCSVHVYGKKYICMNTFLETEIWLTAAGIRIPCIT